MSTKSWKDLLLSSGIPLEYSVSRVFETLGTGAGSEFRYERTDEHGIRRVFSVDVHSARHDWDRGVTLETLVECKYRHDGTKWVFLPEDYSTFLGPDFDDAFVTLDQCCPDRRLNTQLLAEFRERYPLCSKGIELLPTDKNPKSIEQAVQQLRHAVTAKTITDLRWMGAEFRPPAITAIVPMVVTTADLWRLKSDCTVDDVRQAEELTDVAEQHDLLVLQQAPDNIDREAALLRFNTGIDETLAGRLDELMKAAMGPKYGFANFVSGFARTVPSMFVIIGYARFEEAMRNLHAFFEREDLLVPRDPG